VKRKEAPRVTRTENSLSFQRRIDRMRSAVALLGGGGRMGVMRRIMWGVGFGNCVFGAAMNVSA
jgi:hypothetical protein